MISFEKELILALQITDNIIIGGDWNAHNPAWLDKNIDAVGEIILDFIITNNLHILNSMPYDCTLYKNGGSSCVDITLCSLSLVEYCHNWSTNQDDFDLYSDHLPITFNIITNWSSSTINKQKIETWNLRSDCWELYRTKLDKALMEWEIQLPVNISTIPGTKDELDHAIESWTRCLIKTAKSTIGMKTIWKGNKAWWSYKLSKQRKNVQMLKRIFRRIRNNYNFQKYKEAVRELKQNLRIEKHKYLTKSIQSLGDGNIRQLFTQFRSMNTNKISIIPTLVQNENKKDDNQPNTIYQNDQEKDELLVNWFAQPLKLPQETNTEYYQILNIISQITLKITENMR